MVASILALSAVGIVLLSGDGGPGGRLGLSTPATNQAPSTAATTTPGAALSAPPSASPVPASGGNPGRPGVVANEGIAAWDALAEGERTSVIAFQSFFLHQSVGQDLEDGAESVGFPFEFADSTSAPGPGLNGGTFASSNGDPDGKIAEFTAMALANQATVRVAIMKFGYADIVGDTIEDVQAAYQAAVGEIRGRGIRVLHVTPPLVHASPADNAPKMEMRSWMIATFPGDVVFDLQDVESTDPDTSGRCERGGSWEICESVRSTAACASLGQGIDAPAGQGHICHTHAERFARAFLYAIYLAGH
jgi:hypothetical protein